MDDSFSLVVFQIDRSRYALHMESVDRVVRMVELTPIPNVPEYIMGLINLQGSVIPVINLRKVFGLPDKAISLSDQLIITRTSTKTIALYIDTVIGNASRTTDEITDVKNVYPGIHYFEGVIKFDDGLILIHNLDQFLSDEEVQLLQKMIQAYKKQPQTSKTKELPVSQKDKTKKISRKGK